MNKITNENLEKKIDEQKRKAKKKIGRTIKDYKKFALKGNILDLAIGVVIGSAFTSIVNTLVNSIIMPFISLLTNKVDLSTLFVSLDGKRYESIALAKQAGGIIIEYGALLNALLNFFIISVTLFFIVRRLNNVKIKTDDNEKEVQKITHKDCPYCKNNIPVEAIRCGFCTSELSEIPRKEKI